MGLHSNNMRNRINPAKYVRLTGSGVKLWRGCALCGMIFEKAGAERGLSIARSLSVGLYAPLL
jgi:hypothetical protein